MSDQPKILIASDHGGFELKQKLLEYLKQNNYLFEDRGCFDLNSVDYPDLATSVARDISRGAAKLGILICGTGIGMAIAANKFPGVRASVVGDIYSAQMTREHNDLNILCMGGRVLTPAVAIQITDLFLKTPFAGGRHQVRLDKIKQVEFQNFKN